MTLLRAFVLLAAFLVAPFAHAAERPFPTQAQPAFWVVEKDGKKVYLLGSIHLLPPQVKWRRPEIDEAIASAQVFVFEAPLDGASGAMNKFVEEGGKLSDGQTLEDLMPAADFEKLEDAAWKVNYPVHLLQPFRPWLAAVSLELFAYLKAGFSTWYGVDFVIEDDAKKRGAELAYLETIEEQLSFFSSLDRKTELLYLRETVRSIMEEPGMANDLLDAWASGQVGEIAAQLEQSFVKTPKLRERLLVARNTNWIPKIEAMIASGKTHFITVGVGHLVGRDSVIALLKARGYKVTGP